MLCRRVVWSAAADRNGRSCAACKGRKNQPLAAALAMPVPAAAASVWRVRFTKVPHAGAGGPERALEGVAVAGFEMGRA
jgi:hypothetical protein